MVESCDHLQLSDIEAPGKNRSRGVIPKVRHVLDRFFEGLLGLILTFCIWGRHRFFLEQWSSTWSVYHKRWGGEASYRIPTYDSYYGYATVSTWYPHPLAVLEEPEKFSANQVSKLKTSQLLWTLLAWEEHSYIAEVHVALGTPRTKN